MSLTVLHAAAERRRRRWFSGHAAATVFKRLTRFEPFLRRMRRFVNLATIFEQNPTFHTIFREYTTSRYNQVTWHGATHTRPLIELGYGKVVHLTVASDMYFVILIVDIIIFIYLYNF